MLVLDLQQEEQISGQQAVYQQINVCGVGHTSLHIVTDNTPHVLSDVNMQEDVSEKDNTLERGGYILKWIVFRVVFW